jgi:biotin transport system substrate-specific component
MARAAVSSFENAQSRPLTWPAQLGIVVGASLFVALCARVTVPLLPLSPVPLTLQNMGVLLVGIMLGSRRGAAALALYLAEGAMGLPVFSPAANLAGAGSIAHLFGPTGGYLIAYPLVAFVAGWITERGNRTFLRAVAAGIAAEAVLFAGGLSWLAILTHSISTAVRYGLYWFVFAEVIKVLLAAGISTQLRRGFRSA